jgi:hypothetical protein
VKRIIFLLVLLSSSQAFASEYWFPGTNTAAQYATPQLACSQGYPGTNKVYGIDYIGPTTMSTQCWWKGTSEPNSAWVVTGNAYRVIVAEPPPPVDPCAANAGTSSTWKKTYEGFDSYNPLGETTSQGGCGLTITNMECGSSATGEFACWGTGTYTGTTLAEQEVGGVEDCTENCSPPDAKSTTNDQQCTANAQGGVTCVTSSSSTEFSASQCSVGSVGGATGYVCTKPDYVPESAGATKTDSTTVTQNPDGTTTTTVTSTTDNTYCSGGGCTTTTTTTTGATTTDAAGNLVGKTEECTGPNCKGPVDETTEEEEDGTAVFGSSGQCPDGICASSLANPYGQDVVLGFGESMQLIFNGVGNSPIGNAVANLNFPTGGTCPVYDLQLFSSVIVVDQHCSIVESIRGVLQATFLAMWAFLAIRVFLSA